LVLPVPWEVTVSYRAGTAGGPEAIMEASRQLDLHDAVLGEAWREGVAMLPEREEWRRRGALMRKQAMAYIEFLEQGGDMTNRVMAPLAQEVNEACQELNQQVKLLALEHLKQGKTLAVLGGDHSTPLGLLQALEEQGQAFGILQIDAHADLRTAYEGFKWSHASIMHNALELNQVERLVQVGIRDYCAEEVAVQHSDERVRLFSMQQLEAAAFELVGWRDQCQRIIAELPDLVYISFDIDGLEPHLCPGTGTPVPGGLSYNQAAYLVQQVVLSGKRVIGFDLCEVSPSSEWDAIVGARLLFQLCQAALASRA